MSDKYDQQAEELLPCNRKCHGLRDSMMHDMRCSWHYRPAIAARLRRIGELLESARAIGEERRIEITQLVARIARLRTELIEIEEACLGKDQDIRLLTDERNELSAAQAELNEIKERDDLHAEIEKSLKLGVEIIRADQRKEGDK
jgi:hypothetical protein